MPFLKAGLKDNDKTSCVLRYKVVCIPFLPNSLIHFVEITFVYQIKAWPTLLRNQFYFLGLLCHYQPKTRKLQLTVSAANFLLSSAIAELSFWHAHQPEKTVGASFIPFIVITPYLEERDGQCRGKGHGYEALSLSLSLLGTLDSQCTDVQKPLCQCYLRSLLNLYFVIWFPDTSLLLCPISRRPDKCPAEVTSSCVSINDCESGQKCCFDGCNFRCYGRSGFQPQGDLLISDCHVF